jgi:hypothetical protein
MPKLLSPNLILIIDRIPAAYRHHRVGLYRIQQPQPEKSCQKEKDATIRLRNQIAKANWRRGSHRQYIALRPIALRPYLSRSLPIYKMHGVITNYLFNTKWLSLSIEN